MPKHLAPTIAALVAVLTAGCSIGNVFDPGVEVVATYDATGNAQTEPLREIVPRTDAGAPEITGWETNLGMGMEGSVSFMRATGADGMLVLDRVIDSNADTQALPAGSYTLSEYYRNCGGSCDDLLEAAQLVCAVEAVLAEGGHYRIAITARPRDSAPYPDNVERECTLTEE